MGRQEIAHLNAPHWRDQTEKWAYAQNEFAFRKEITSKG
jgi:hypothetical protein